jgi:uncharacterized membrane protein
MALSPRFIKLIKLHPRLLVATATGLLVGFGMPESSALVDRAVIAWNAGVWLYLAMIWTLMARAKSADVKELAGQEDESATMVLVFVCIAALASLAAIVLQLGNAKELSGVAKLVHYGLTAATVSGSWCVVATIFTVHYTGMYYAAEDNQRPLKFPEDCAEPNYWDFLYFSFTIAAAAQTADIAILRTSMRKAVLAQSILSFVFNTAIVGLSINIAAGLIGN